jgi:hypothetical protein
MMRSHRTFFGPRRAAPCLVSMDGPWVGRRGRKRVRGPDVVYQLAGNGLSRTRFYAPPPVVAAGVV